MPGPEVCAAAGAAPATTAIPATNKLQQLRTWSLRCLVDAVLLPVRQHPGMVLAELLAGVALQIVEQVGQLGNGTDLHAQVVAHVLHGAVVDVAAVLGGLLLAI